MYIDYHVHCHHSDDSHHLIEDVVKDAIEIGLKEICFTDHVDYGVKPDWENAHLAREYKGEKVLNVNYPVYFSDIARLQAKYKDQIIIKKGLEFGIQSHTIEPFQKLFDTYPMDFVLLSIHQIGDKEFWTGEFQQGKSDIECYREYYQEMLDVIKDFKSYSCLAHMDLIRRYIDKNVDMFEATRDQIKEILELVIADGKGIEVNTSSVRYGVNGLTPSIEILKLYYELGGTIVTIGSDSHQKDHLGFDIEQSKQILKEIGFEFYCTFNNMVPHFHKL